VFQAELAAEAMVGNTWGSNLRIEGDSIMFDAPEIFATAAASVIHRAVEKTNRKVADLRAQQEEQIEALKQDYGKAGRICRADTRTASNGTSTT